MYVGQHSDPRHESALFNTVLVIRRPIGTIEYQCSTDGNLSRHLTTLEAAGYIKLDKVFENRKPRTWITATPSGRRALKTEIEALREIVVANADIATTKTHRQSHTRLAIP
jgi:DNA-binding PadR family transcriptional regulator